MANPGNFLTGAASASGSSRIFTVSAATGAGDDLCILINITNTTTLVSACADSKGNVYTLDQSYVAVLPMVYMYRSPGKTGGSGGGPTAALTTSDTVTVTTAAVSGFVTIVGTNVPNTDGLDLVSSIVTQTTGTSPSQSITPTLNNDTLIGALISGNGGGVPTLAAAFTLSGQAHTGTQAYSTTAYDVLTGQAGTPQTFSATVVATPARTAIWAFKARQGVPTAPLTLAVAVLGAKRSTATVTSALSPAVAATGAKRGVGTASAALTLSTSATGLVEPYEGIATAPLTLGTSVTGHAARSGSVSAPLVLGTSATGRVIPNRVPQHLGGSVVFLPRYDGTVHKLVKYDGSASPSEGLDGTLDEWT